MKRLFALILALIFIFTILTACNNATDSVTPAGNGVGGAKSSNEYEKGSFDETSFESKYLNLRFTLPDGFVMATEEDINNMMNLGADVMGLNKKIVDYASLTTVYEMMASAPSGLPNVIVGVEKLQLSNITLDQYFDALKTQLANLPEMNYEFSGDIASLEIAGQSYKQLTATLNMADQSITQRYIARKNDNRMVFFITTGDPDTEKELSTLIAGFANY
jgi:hypothetical protein